MEWNRPAILDLIKAVKNRPAIWDTHSIEYRDKYERRQCFSEIAQVFNCSRGDVEKKVANLRTQYGRELAKIAKCKETGGNYSSRWFAFKYLTFLTPKYSKQQSKSKESKSFEIQNEPTTEEIEGFVQVKLEEKENLVDDDMNLEVSAGYQVLSSEDTALAAKEQLHYEKSPAMSPDQQCLVESTSKIVQCGAGYSLNEQTHRKFPKPNLVQKHDVSIKDIFQDEFDIFGQSVAAQLRSLADPYARSIAKFNIQKALFEAETRAHAGKSPTSN